MQNHVKSVRHSWVSFRKKAIVHYYKSSKLFSQCKDVDYSVGQKKKWIMLKASKKSENVELDCRLLFNKSKKPKKK